jgi:hypothetical protein
VSGKEGQFSIDSIFNTFFRIALIERAVIVVKNLQIILAPTDVAGEGSDRDLGLNLTGSHYYGLHDDKRPYLFGRQLSD